MSAPISVCRQLGHHFPVLVKEYIAGTSTCTRCGAIKKSDGKGNVQFTYPTANSPTTPMTRREAIDLIQFAFYAQSQEFSVSTEDGEAFQRECRDALRTLGVTDAEIDGEAVSS